MPAETINADINTSVDMLHNLSGKIWKEENVPKEWKHGYVIKLAKNVDLTECKNLRGIILLSVTSKVLDRIILERINSRNREA